MKKICPFLFAMIIWNTTSQAHAGTEFVLFKQDTGSLKCIEIENRALFKQQALSWGYEYSSSPKMEMYFKGDNLMILGSGSRNACLKTCKNIPPSSKINDRDCKRTYKFNPSEDY